MTLAILIVICASWAAILWLLVIVNHLKNRSSTPPSPTPNTTPTPISDGLVLQMMKAMAETFREQSEATRKMVTDLVVGREQPPPTTTAEILETLRERPIEYDYDSTPLPAGIVAIEEREERETHEATLLKERAELQERLVQVQQEVDRFDSETSFETGPYQDPTNGTRPKHARAESSSPPSPSE